MVGHVFDLYFVIERHSAGSCFDRSGEEEDGPMRASQNLFGGDNF